MSRLTQGSLRVAAGTQSIATSTTAAKVTAFSGNLANASTPFSTDARDGDHSVVPDLANDRIKLHAPGSYQIELNIRAAVTGANTYDVQIRKNDVVVAGLKTGELAAAADVLNLSITGTIDMAVGDGTLAQFADPPTTGFAGAGAAPKTLGWVDFVVSNPATTGAFVVTDCEFTVTRIR
jgi:hypothetical protein